MAVSHWIVFASLIRGSAAQPLDSASLLASIGAIAKTMCTFRFTFQILRTTMRLNVV